MQGETEKVGCGSATVVDKGEGVLGGNSDGAHAEALEKSRVLDEPAGRQLHLAIGKRELGHFLGAAHSPEFNSAMRPVLGDGRARARAFRLGIDPANTLAIYLVAEEYRLRNVARVSQLSLGTRVRLQQIYRTLHGLPGVAADRDCVAAVAGDRLGADCIAAPPAAQG